jgi:hypothetical protein
LILEDARDLFRKDVLGDHRFGDRPRAAKRVGSCHGQLGEVEMRMLLRH